MRPVAFDTVLLKGVNLGQVVILKNESYHKNDAENDKQRSL